MTRRLHFGRARTLAAMAWLVPAAPAQRDLRGILPDETVFAVETTAPDQALAAIVAALGPLPEGLPSAVVALVGVGLTAARAALGGWPSEFAARMGGGGAVLGIVPVDGAPVPVFVLRPGDLDAAVRWCEGAAPNVHWALASDLLLLSTKAAGLELLRARLDAAPVRSSDAAPGDGVLLRGTVDLAALRRLPGVSLRGEGLDAGGRFLLAPLVHVLATADRATFALRAAPAASALALEFEVFGTVAGSPGQALVPHAGRPRAALRPPDGTIGLLALDRSLRALLAEPERHLAPAEVVGVRSFLSVADALDGAPSSFVDDLLGGLDEPMALHVLPAAAPDDGAARPPLLLPEFALVAPIRDPTVVPILLRTAQTFATIANAERAQQRRMPFVVRGVRVEAEDGTRVDGVCAEPPEWRGPGAPPTEAALSPTLLCGHGHAVLATTRRAADAMLEQARRGRTVERRGDCVEVRGTPLAAAIAASRGVLELGRVLDEGEDPAAAARFFDVVAAVAGAVERIAIAVEPGETTTRCELRLERRR